MARLHRPRTPRTLRGRLIGLLAFALVLGFAAAAVIMVLLVKHVLIGRLDAQLQAAGDRFSVSLERGTAAGAGGGAGGGGDNGGASGGASGDDQGYGQVEGQLAGTLGARSKGGQVTAAAIVGDDHTSDQVPAAARAVLGRFTRAGGPVTVALPGLGDYRILIAAGRDGDLQITGLPAQPIEHTTDLLVLTVVSVFAVTLVLLVAVSAGLVRIMLRPLARISATAAHVADLPLGSGGVSLPGRVEEGAEGSELNVLAQAFNAMLTQVESALRTRADSEERLRRFVADASHELRTPVAVVRSHAELARREGGEGLAEPVARSLDRITAQAERMGALVEDLLLLARLDAGRPLAVEPVDVVHLALEAVEDARISAPAHRWRLALPEDPLEVSGDPHALGQVLSNLLANVATHTPAGTTATVRIAAAHHDEHDEHDTHQEVELEVADDGPGMPPELAATAFDRFARGDGSRGVSGGSSGLGLAIVAAIVAAHQGTLKLTSTPSGTLVRITLPAAAAPSE